MLLKLGSKGQEVKELQQALGLTPSAIFDQTTHDAVMAYQRKKGLIVDGLVVVDAKMIMKKIIFLMLFVYSFSTFAEKL